MTCLRGEEEIKRKTDTDGLPCMKHHSSIAKLLDSVGSVCMLCIGLWRELPPNTQHILKSYRRVHDMPEQSFWSVLECHYDYPCENDFFQGWPVGTYHFDLRFSSCFRHRVPEIYADPLLETTIYRLYAVPSSGSSIDMPAQCFKFLLMNVQATTAVEESNPPSMTSSTGDEETLKEAWEWLRTCSHLHGICNKVDDPTWLPTRLLEIVTGPTAESVSTVKLINTSKAKISGSYNTLSHCWADGNFLRLTQGTTNMLADGVALCQLPQSFRDAISVTSKMRVSYI